MLNPHSWLLNHSYSGHNLPTRSKPASSTCMTWRVPLSMISSIQKVPGPTGNWTRPTQRGHAVKPRVYNCAYGGPQSFLIPHSSLLSPRYLLFIPLHHLWFLTVNFSFFTAYSSQLFTSLLSHHYSHLTRWCLLLTTSYSLFALHCSLLTLHCSCRIAHFLQPCTIFALVTVSHS